MLPYRPHLSIVALAIAISLVAAACSSPEPEAPEVEEDTDADASEATGEDLALVGGEFNVVGKDIIGPDGNIFIPIGANVGPPVQDSVGTEIRLYRLRAHDITSPESAAAIDEWGWNFLRVNTECTAQPGDDVLATWGNEEMFAALDQMIDLYTAKEIVVMIDCHNLNTETLPDIDGAEYQEISEFWQEAAERYGDNAYVWFNHLNEFHKGQEPVSAWQEVVDDGYQLFTETGTKNLVVFDLPNFGQDIEIMLDPEFQDWSKTMCNVIWDWHSYGGIVPEGGDLLNPQQEEFEAEVNKVVAGVVEAEIPIVVGEFGYDWDSERKSSNFDYRPERAGAIAALKIAPENGYGLAAWHANGDSGRAMVYGLKKSDDQTFDLPTASENLSEMGELLWDISQEQRAAEPQPGPTDGGCSR